ncbi:MAG: PTS glucitol/sorbitol transporter subunit IIA [Desemzia incerta]
MLITKITAIGNSAISKRDPLIILFGEQATEELRKVSVIQSKVSEDHLIELKTGGIIAFGEQEYEILDVGSLANTNLNSIGHVTLNFAQPPEAKEDRIENGVYLTPFELPELSVGLEITYKD